MEEGGFLGSLRLGIAQGRACGFLGREGDVSSALSYWLLLVFSLQVRRQLIAGSSGGRRTAEAGATCWSDLGRRRATRKDGQVRGRCCRLQKAGCREKGRETREEVGEEEEGKRRRSRPWAGPTQKKKEEKKRKKEGGERLGGSDQMGRKK